MYNPVVNAHKAAGNISIKNVKLLPKTEHEERQSRARERDSTDFMRFVAMPGGEAPTTRVSLGAE